MRGREDTGRETRGQTKLVEIPLLPGPTVGPMHSIGRTPHLSPWNGTRDADGAGFQRALSDMFPACTHPGGLAWEISTGQLPDHTVVAHTPTGVTGWAAFSADDTRLECAPEDDATSATLTSWLFDVAAGSRFSIAVHHEQHALQQDLISRGFVAEALPLAGLNHPAESVGAHASSGYRVRPMDDGEQGRRIETHRRAWKPANLPFTDGSGGDIDPKAESRFSSSALESMQAAPLYRRDLDLVIEAPDGSLAGCCTVWLDPVSGWAELEPLGIVPSHRGLGLAQALALEACRLTGELGGHSVFINSAPLPYYRAPWDAYLKAGLTPMNRGIRMSQADDVHPH